PECPRDYETAKQKLRETLSEAVQLRMRSDVPLGAFLSGGIDSTIICGLMQKFSSRPVKTFSIGFPVKSFDERTFARAAAEHLGTEHYEQVVEPSALQILPKLIWHYDEPFADSSAIPCLYLAEMTRRQVTVALSGDGGDELFAGYRRYQAVRISGWLDHLPRFVQRSLGSDLVQRIPTPVAQYSKLRRLKKLCSALGESPERRYLKWVSILDADRRKALYHPDFEQRLGTADAADFLLDAYQLCPKRDFITRTTAVDVLTYLPCDILTKVDISTMAYSLESRNPFLDHHVVDLAAQMPIEWKLSGQISKKILIESFPELLPDMIRTRSKMGFGVPLDHWFRGELRPLLEDILLSQRALERGLFQPGEVKRLVEEHQACTWDHSHRLWGLLVLELWYRTFIDGEIPTGPATGL
ncbi:MAG: asparagine synthase-related protein, partial [Planctomycetales bacterium]